jgi:hypothetical protein
MATLLSGIIKDTCLCYEDINFINLIKEGESLKLKYWIRHVRHNIGYSFTWARALC